MSYIIYVAGLLALLYFVHEPDDATSHAGRMGESSAHVRTTIEKDPTEGIVPDRDFPHQSRSNSSQPITAKEALNTTDTAIGRIRAPQRRVN